MHRALLPLLASAILIGGCVAPTGPVSNTPPSPGFDGCPSWAQCAEQQGALRVDGTGAGAISGPVEFIGLKQDLILQNLRINSTTYGLYVTSTCESCSLSMDNITVHAATAGILVQVFGPVEVSNIDVTTVGGGTYEEGSGSRAGIPVFTTNGGGAGIQAISRDSVSLTDAKVRALHMNVQGGIDLRASDPDARGAEGAPVPRPVILERATVAGHGIGVNLQGQATVRSVSVECSRFGVLADGNAAMTDVEIHGCWQAGIIGSGNWDLKDIRISDSAVAILCDEVYDLTLQDFNLERGEVGISLYYFGFNATLRDGIIKGFQKQGAVLSWPIVDVTNVTFADNGHGEGGTFGNLTLPNGGLLFPFQPLATVYHLDVYLYRRVVSDSQFMGNAGWAAWVSEANPVPVVAQGNWWNSSAGPTLRLPGDPPSANGRDVSVGIEYAPWKRSP